MKFVLLFVLISLATSVVFAHELTTEKRYADWGVVAIGDQLIRRDVIIKDFSSKGVKTFVYRFPTGDFPALFKYNVITAFKVTDKKKDDSSGAVKLLIGGPGSKDVTIELVSKKYRGIHVVIEIWGH